jgi:polar amino acid transport system permease protein
MSEPLLPAVSSGPALPTEAGTRPQPFTMTEPDLPQGPAAGPEADRAAGPTPPDDGARPRPLSAQRVIPLRHPGRWIVTAAHHP